MNTTEAQHIYLGNIDYLRGDSNWVNVARFGQRANVVFAKCCRTIGKLPTEVSSMGYISCVASLESVTLVIMYVPSGVNLL